MNHFVSVISQDACVNIHDSFERVIREMGDHRVSCTEMRAHGSISVYEGEDASGTPVEIIERVLMSDVVKLRRVGA